MFPREYGKTDPYAPQIFAQETGHTLDQPFRPLHIPRPMTTESRTTSLGQRALDLPIAAYRSYLSILQSDDDSLESPGKNTPLTIPITDSFHLQIPSSAASMDISEILIPQLREELEVLFGRKTDEVLEQDESATAVLSEDSAEREATINHLKVFQFKLNYYEQYQQKIDYQLHVTDLISTELDIIRQLTEKIETRQDLPTDRKKTDDTIQGLMRASLIICFTPETTDAATLENFLLIDSQELNKTCNLEHLYTRLTALAKHEEPLLTFTRIHEAGQNPKRDIRKFLYALDEQLSNDKSIRKPLRRIHEFSGQVRDYLVHVYNNMTGHNLSFEQLPPFHRQSILECAGKSVRYMANNGLLLDKVEFYKEIYFIFDRLLGTPTSELKAVSGLKTSHRNMIAEHVFNEALKLPELIDIQNNDRRNEREKINNTNQRIKQLKDEKSELEERTENIKKETSTQQGNLQELKKTDFRLHDISDEIKKEIEIKTKAVESIFKQAAIQQEQAICQGFDRLIHDMLTRFAPQIKATMQDDKVSDKIKPHAAASDVSEQLSIFGFSTDRLQNLGFRKQLDIRFQILKHFCNLYDEVSKTLEKEEAEDLLDPVFARVVARFLQKLNTEITQLEQSLSDRVHDHTDEYLKIMESEHLQAKADIMNHYQEYQKDYMVQVANTLNQLNLHMERKQTCCERAAETVGNIAGKVDIRTSLSESAKNYKDIDRELKIQGAKASHSNKVTINLIPPDDPKGKVSFREALEIYKILKTLRPRSEGQQTGAPQDLVTSILREPQAGKVSRNRVAHITEWDSRQIEQALTSIGTWTRFTSTLKHTVRGFSGHGWYHDIARETHHLQATENHRKCDLIKMDTRDHKTLISLTQIALQHTRLTLNNQYPGDDRIARVDRAISNMISRRQAATDSGTCNPMDRFLEIFDAIVAGSGQSTAPFTGLREDLVANFNSILQDFNNTAKANYIGMMASGASAPSWPDLVRRHQHNARSFREVFLYKIDQKNRKEADIRNLLADVFDIYQHSLEYCFNSKVAHQRLPSAKETVRYLQMAVALKSGAKTGDSDNLDSYRFTLCHYNDHLDAMAMQMADVVFNEGMKRNTRNNDLDSTFARVMAVAQTEAMMQLAEIGQQFSKDRDDQEKLQALNKKLDQLFQQSELQRFFSQKSGAGKLMLGTWHYMKQQQAFLPGFFVGCAITSMIFTGTATDLLKDIQTESDKISKLIFAIKAIIDQLNARSPELNRYASMVFSVSPNEQSALCADKIFSLSNAPLNISLNEGLSKLEADSQALQTYLRANDAEGCPSGGLEKFPPGVNYNLANLITTFASIGSGLVACLGGWYQEVKHRTHDVNHYSTTPMAFQSLPPELTETLMLKTAQQFEIHNQDSDEIYPGLKAYCGLEKLKHGIFDCIDFMICNPNPEIRGRKVWPIIYFLTFALRPASMALPKRPHSYQELLTRLQSAANSRIAGTLLRMGGYNTAKEFMDVFKSRAYMLGFLIVLKELDMPIALNEKASISDYLTLRSMETKLSATLHNLQGQKPLDSAAIAMLRNTYGDVLMDSILGPAPDIQNLEQELSSAWSCITHTVCGLAPMVTIYTLEALNLIWYTVNPISMAQQLLDKAGNIFNNDELTLAETIERLFGKDSDAIKKMAKKARSTMKYDTTPRDLSDLELLCHYASGGRSTSKAEQSTLLWGIKELINLSMYTNTTLHERDMGIQSINWEALGAFVAYLIKDSTGIAARYAMLLDDETLRTFFSLLDKLDSPLAEYAISKLAKIGLYCPQSIRNTVGDMVDESVIASSGNVEEIHSLLTPKFEHLRRIGLPNLNRATKIIADRVESTVLPAVYRLAEQTEGNYAAARATEVDFFNEAIAKVRETMPRHLVSYGAKASPETEQRVKELQQFCHTIGKDDARPEVLTGYLEQLMTHYTKEDIEAFLAKHIIQPLQSIDPAEKAELLKKHGTYASGARRSDGVIIEQPGSLSGNPQQYHLPEITLRDRTVTTV